MTDTIEIPEQEYRALLKQQKALFNQMKSFYVSNKLERPDVKQDNSKAKSTKQNGTGKDEQGKSKMQKLDINCPGRVWLDDDADKSCVGGARSNEKARIKHDGHYVTICYACKLWRDRQKRANKKVQKKSENE